MVMPLLIQEGGVSRVDVASCQRIERARESRRMDVKGGPKRRAPAAGAAGALEPCFAFTRPGSVAVVIPIVGLVVDVGIGSVIGGPIDRNGGPKNQVEGEPG